VSERHAKRGRPPKFGRRGHVIAVTLPDDVVRGLRKVDQDLAWAIVSLFNKQPLPRPSNNGHHRLPEDAELVAVGGRRSLIVVNSEVFRDLPGISMIPLDHSNGGRAFLALAPGQGMSDLELAVVDRLGAPAIAAREKQALERLRSSLREWRRDPALRCETKSIIVIERVKNGR
jgi:hypothetical protein